MNNRTATYIAKQCFNIGCASILFLDILKEQIPAMTGFSYGLMVIGMLLIGDGFITLYIHKKFKNE